MRVIPLETPPGRRHAVPVIFLMVVGIIGSLLFRAMTDVPFISAPPELEPPEEPAWAWRDSVETNGWAFLHVKLLEEAEAAKKVTGSFAAGKPRKRPSALDTRPVGATTEWVEEALRKPDFRVGIAPFAGETWFSLLQGLRADFAAGLSSRNEEGVARELVCATRLSALILRECFREDDYRLGATMQSSAAVWTLDALAADPQNRAAAAAMARDWAQDFYVKEAALRRLTRSTLARNTAPTGYGVVGAARAALQSRPNKTRRLLLREAGLIQELAMRPVGSLEESPGMRAMVRNEVSSTALYLLDSNRMGLLEVMPGWAAEYNQEEAILFRGDVFVSRAMRAALALWLWRIDHGGALPATLAELVPDYLPEIPADPWNGAPLGWDPAKMDITGVGSDWKPGGTARWTGAAPGLLTAGGENPKLRLPDPAAPAPPTP